MRRALLVPLAIALCIPAAAQNFRVGWREDAPTERNPESFNVVAFDAAGNAIMAGTAQFPGNAVDVVVRKLDPFGKELWRTRFDAGDANQTDFVQGLVLDAKGDAYLSLDYPQKGYGKFALAKVNGADGKVAFKRIHDTGNDRAQPTAIARDPNTGELVQAGGFGSNGRAEIYVVKWSPEGKELWAQRWTNGEGSDRQAQAVGIAPNGDISVAGYSFATGKGQDSAVLRYDSSGKLKWSVTFSGVAGFGNDIARALTHDPNGDVIVTGEEYVEGSASYLYVAKMAAASGSTSWKHQLRDVRNSAPQPVGVVRVSDGYLVGGDVYEVTADRPDFVVMKIGFDGSRTWKRMVNSGAGFDDQASSLAVDAYGYAYLAGTSTNASRESKYFAVCLNPKGEVMWQHRDTAGTGPSVPGMVAVDSDSGHVAVVGNRASGVLDDWNLLTLFQAPRAADDRYSVIQGETLNVGVGLGLRSNDVFHKHATLEAAATVDKGTLKVNADGSLSYVAPADFVGTVTFTYKLVREGLTTSEAKATINVLKKPTPPPGR